MAKAGDGVRWASVSNERTQGRARGRWRAAAGAGVVVAALTTSVVARADGAQGDGPVDPFFGSFGTAISIDVPSQRGFEPHLALQYNSQLGNGRVGVGWSLGGFATIERVGAGKGAPRWDGGDGFLLDGQELVACGALGGTHCTKIQSYKRVTFDAAANAWYVWDKDGTKLTLSPIFGTARGTFRWGLTSAVDARGNALSYGWWCDGGNDCYPSAVTYNGNAINLYWEGRADAQTFATGAGLGRTSYRLKTIDVLARGARARSYKLSYATAAGSQASLVTSVQRFGADAALDGSGTVVGGTALPALTAGYAAEPQAYGAARWATQSGGYWDGQRWFVGDFDGNGKSDFANLFNDNGAASIDLKLSTGSGLLAQRWLTQSGGYWDAQKWFVGDFNGDGKSDFANVFGDAGSASIDVKLSTGSGFAAQRWATQQGGFWDAQRWFTGDFNGDGKTDLAKVFADAGAASIDVHLSTGGGFVAQRWLTQSGGYWDAQKWSVADLNGDGKADFANVFNDNGAASIDVKLSTGSGLFVTRWATQQGGFWDGQRWLTGDFDGDGKEDFGTVFNDNGAASIDLHALSTGPANLIASLGNGHGGTTTISYAGSSSWANGYLPSGMAFPTVRATTIADGRGATSTTSYVYAGGLWSDAERRFLGFRKVTSVIDAAGDYTETYYHQHVGCISKPEVTYYRDATGAILKYSTFGYQESATAPYTSLMTDRWEYECNQGSSCRRTLTQIGYDQYGNGTTTYEWGDYDAAGDERTTVRAAVPNAGAYIVGLPAYENVYAGIGTGGRLLKQSLNVYDGNAGYASAPTKGLVTARLAWNSQTGGYVTTSYGYDAWGNETSETDALGRTRTWAWDSIAHVHEVQRCNALGQCSSKSWLGSYDVLASETDANGGVTTYTHDALMRPVTTTQANGAWETLSYLDWGNAGLQRVRKTASDGTPDGLWTETYEDGAGRVWRTVKEGGQTQDTAYLDASSRVWRRSLWYGPGEAPIWQTNAYDGLGRLRTVTNADGTYGQLVYGNGWVASNDELGHERVTFADAFGATSQVREKNGASYYFTTYQHDLLGNLTRVTDALGNVTQTTWDSLGRKVAGCDPDTGCSSYQYDAVGQAVWRKDGKGQLTTTVYDAVGRPVQRTRGDGALTTWRYDEAGHGAGVGRFTSVSDPSGTESRSYDSAGNVTSTTKCVAGTCATTSYGYDAAGRPSSITYPNGEVVSYGYDAAGRVASVTGYVTSIGYNGRGQVASIAYANGTTASFGYQAQRAWLTSATVTAGSATLYSMTYGYDAAARVTSTNSSTNPLSTLTYGYDELNRLLTVAGGQSQTFAYDAIGRITSNSQIGAYAYGDAAHVHAVTAAGANGYSYDANGNQLTGAGRALTWDADNELAAVTASGKSVTYAYDHAGQRVSRTGSGGATRYFSRLAELAGSTWTNNVWAGDLFVAKNVGGQKRWYHADHLGSTRLVTDASAQALQRHDYAAYGALVSSTGSSGNTRTFGGHDLDVDSGLTFMKARFFDAWLGRFVSADTMVADARNPQAFDRYAFAYGNPISNTDPSGHVPVVAAVVTSIAVGAATEFTGALFVMSVVGAATTTVGYFTHDATLMSIGSVLLGASSGGAFGAGYLAGPGAAGAVWGGSIAALTSPVSPLSSDLKSAIGWAYTGQSLVYGFEHIDETVDEAAKKAKLSDADLAKVESAKNAKLEELARPGNEALRAQYDDIMCMNPERLSASQLRYGRAVEIMTGGKIDAVEAIALNPTGGLVGPGNGWLEQVLDPATGWVPGIRVHAIVHDASGWLRSTNLDEYTIGGLGLGRGYFYAGFNLFGLKETNQYGGQLEGIARWGGVSVQSLLGRMY